MTKFTKAEPVSKQTQSKTLEDNWPRNLLILYHKEIKIHQSILVDVLIWP